MTMQFEAKINRTREIVKLTFSGLIDEDAKFPTFETRGVDKVVIDLDGVKGINSVGIRTWLDWVTPLSNQMALFFERCPKSIVLQFSMVKGFLPDRATVLSFYLPYYCDKCDYEGSHLVVVGQNFMIGPAGPSLLVDPKSEAKCEQIACGIQLTSAGVRALDRITKSIGNRGTGQSSGS
jgi:hypothetical protein